MQRGGSKGTAAARRRRHEGKNEAPLSWPAPAARRVIASPGQASRVRPLLRAISTPPPARPSPLPRAWRSIGPHRSPSSLSALSLFFLCPSSTTTRSPRNTAALAAAPLAFSLLLFIAYFDRHASIAVSLSLLLRAFPSFVLYYSYYYYIPVF